MDIWGPFLNLKKKEELFIVTGGVEFRVSK